MYSFKVRRSDGSEQSFRKPDGALEGVRFQADAPVAVLLKPEEWLEDPQFSRDALDPGEEAALSVAAPDGREVRFILEVQDGEAFKPYRELRAKSVEGRATAKLKADHP